MKQSAVIKVGRADLMARIESRFWPGIRFYAVRALAVVPIVVPVAAYAQQSIMAEPVGAALPGDAISLVPEKEVAGPVQVFVNLALVSDYRDRGTSYSRGKPAAQATVTFFHEGGLFAGAYASSTGNDPQYGAVEIDFFAGYSRALSANVTAEAMLLYYYYPDADHALAPATDSFESEFKLTGSFGAVQPSVGVWYSWDQAASGQRDNLYIHSEVLVQLGKSPLSPELHGGYTNGSYSIASDSKTLDWSAGLGFDLGRNFVLGIKYVGIDGPRIKNFTDDTLVLSASAHF
jgi:uncharacterized protein (TIGR02001 family)